MGMTILYIWWTRSRVSKLRWYAGATPRMKKRAFRIILIFCDNFLKSKDWEAQFLGGLWASFNGDKITQGKVEGAWGHLPRDVPRAKPEGHPEGGGRRLLPPFQVWFYLRWKMPTISPRNSVFQAEDFKKLSQKIRIMRNALFFILGFAPAYHCNLETQERVDQIYSIVIPIQCISP